MRNSAEGSWRRGAVPFGKKIPIQLCRRRFRRQVVMLAGSALSITRSRSIAVSDLSATGACIGGRDLPLAGDDMLFVIGSSDRMARVMWRVADRCGIQFDQPLREDTIELMKREAQWAEVAGWVH